MHEALRRSPRAGARDADRRPSHERRRHRRPEPDGIAIDMDAARRRHGEPPSTAAGCAGCFVRARAPCRRGSAPPTCEPLGLSARLAVHDVLRPATTRARNEHRAGREARGRHRRGAGRVFSLNGTMGPRTRTGASTTYRSSRRGVLGRVSAEECASSPRRCSTPSSSRACRSSNGIPTSSSSSTTRWVATRPCGGAVRLQVPQRHGPRGDGAQLGRERRTHCRHRREDGAHGNLQRREALLRYPSAGATRGTSHRRLRGVEVSRIDGTCGGSTARATSRRRRRWSADGRRTAERQRCSSARGGDASTVSARGDWSARVRDPRQAEPVPSRAAALPA